MKNIIANVVAFIVCFVIGFLIVWAVIQPHKTYLGTYCNPQNQCRYETFDYECPPTDSSNVIIGQIGKLKKCEEQK